MIDLGKVKPGSTVRIPFGSYAAATGASSPTTNYAAADVQIYKDGNTTQRASAAGITASTDFDGFTGLNLITIDLSDNTTAGFYVAGSEYLVLIADVTIDVQTVRFPAARFIIGMPGEIHATTIATLASQTSFTLTVGAPDDNAYTNCGIYVHARASATQCCQGFITASNGTTKTVTLAGDPTVFTMAVGDNVSIFPRVNVGSFSGLTVSLNNLISFFTSTGYANANNSIGTVTGAVGSVTGNLGGNVVGSVGSVAANGVSASSLATDGVNEIRDAIMTYAVDGATTFEQSIRLSNSALGAKCSGLDTGAPVYRDLADTKDRISATADTNGNRSAVSRTLT